MMVRRIALLLCLLLLVAGGNLLAQTPVTKITEYQLQGTPTSALAQVWITMPDGTVKQAMIETDKWEIAISGTGQPILRPKVQPQSPASNDVVGEKPTQTGNQDGREYTVSNQMVSGSLKVYRNGLRQTEGVDYSLPNNTTILFIEHYKDDADALVVADYKHIP